MRLLLPQVDKYKGQIEVLIFWNDCKHTIGYYRQKMMEDARGEYISHIDDDDLIPKDFCDTIFPLLDGVDYIGFRVELNHKSLRFLPVYHSLQYDRWIEDDTGYYRGVTHINPIKTEIALKGVFPEVENGEDYQWTVEVHKYMANTPREFTEHFIDRPMYIYERLAHDPEEDKRPEVPKRPKFKSKNVRFHDASD
jgi:hypothetical protein